MAHHLNTNKQFMVGNGIPGFCRHFVVVIFLYELTPATGKPGRTTLY